MSKATLTEANLRKLSGPSREEQESALLERMQTISQLLGQVDAALEAEPSTRPPTGASSRPPPTAGSEPPPTASSRPPPTASSRPATGASINSGADVSKNAYAVAGEGRHPMPAHVNASWQGDADEPVRLVSYTGCQTHMPGNSGRRRIDAKASRSELGSVLYGR